MCDTVKGCFKLTKTPAWEMWFVFDVDTNDSDRAWSIHQPHQPATRWSRLWVNKENLHFLQTPEPF